MGLSLNRPEAYMPQSQPAPQTGMNPNPPAATVTSQPAGKGGAAFTPPQPAPQGGRSDGLDQNAINADPAGFQKWKQEQDALNSRPIAPVMANQQAAAGAMASGSPLPSYAENVYTPQQAPQGKAGGPGQAPGSPAATMGKGGGSSMTSSATSGQPQMGVPNQYSNTVQPMDNRRMGIAGMQARGKGM